MTRIDIRTEKLNLIKQLLKVKDEQLLMALKNMLEFGLLRQAETEQNDFWEELTDAQKQQIELSIKELDEGKGIPHEEVMAELRKKYRA